jgi:hypothetical protein
LANRTVWQSVWFLAVFYLVWPIRFAAFVIPTVPSNYPIYVLAAILSPLQGFLNVLVVFCRDRNRFNDGCPKVRRNCCLGAVQSLQVLDPVKWSAQN